MDKFLGGGLPGRESLLCSQLVGPTQGFSFLRLMLGFALSTSPKYSLLEEKCLLSTLFSFYQFVSHLQGVRHFKGTDKVWRSHSGSF